MPNDDLTRLTYRGARQSVGASALADSAVSVLSQRQAATANGARQFVLDFLRRAILSKNEFDPGAILDELRGHRLSVDSVIDIYVPTMARVLGEEWAEDTLDFASVTVGTMRLQSLLSLASSESLDFLSPIENAMCMLVIVPLGEQHTLGAFVLSAQLRRLGVRVELSFCEEAQDVVSRVMNDGHDMILFTASSQQTLETISQLVLDISKVAPNPPLTAVGGSVGEPDEAMKGAYGIDVVTNSARDAVAFVAKHRSSKPDQTRL